MWRKKICLNWSLWILLGHLIPEVWFSNTSSLPCQNDQGNTFYDYLNYLNNVLHVTRKKNIRYSFQPRQRTANWSYIFRILHQKERIFIELSISHWLDRFCPVPRAILVCATELQLIKPTQNATRQGLILPQSSYFSFGCPVIMVSCTPNFKTQSIYNYYCINIVFLSALWWTYILLTKLMYCMLLDPHFFLLQHHGLPNIHTVCQLQPYCNELHLPQPKYCTVYIAVTIKCWTHG